MKIRVAAATLAVLFQVFALSASADILKVDPALAPAAAGESSPKGPGAASSVKIGFVDVRTVATECEAGKKATAELKATAEKLQAKIHDKEKQLEKLKAGIEAKAATMPLEKRAAKAKEFQKKFDELRSMAQKSEKELREREEQLTEKILETIAKVVREYGSKEGYVAISGKRDLLYADPALSPKDLTQEILPLVNAATK